MSLSFLKKILLMIMNENKMKHKKLVFINALKREFEDFLDVMDEHTGCEIIHLYPSSELDDMVLEINKIKPDMIVTDTLLNEIKEEIEHNVAYNGYDIINRVNGLGIEGHTINVFLNEIVCNNRGE